MTAEPQIGYSGQNEGWQQTPAGNSDAGGPSGLSHALAGYGQPAPPPQASPEPAPSSAFSGHDPDAPSGLSFVAPAPPAYHGEPGYPPAADEAYPPVTPTYPDPATAYPDAAYAAPAQPAYSDAAYPAPPQAAYPPAAPGGYGPAGPGTPAGPGMPGYLQPYGSAGRARGKGPGVGPVIGFTFFFGPFGAISAARRAERARAVGDSTGRYWLAFGATLVGCWVVGAIIGILLIAISIAADAPASKSTTAIELQQSIVQQGTFTDATGKIIKVKTASCVARTLAPNSTIGIYSCALGLTDGTKDTVLVSLDSGGKWKVVGQAK